MRIAFNSSHVTGDFSSRLLTVDIHIEDEATGQSIWSDIEFAVPEDFHTHNDAVAAALMTLAGRKYGEVTFNFPISPFCAETLRRYYGEIEIGPVDPLATPRRPGRRIGLNFSGGLDSTAAWLLLRELYGDDFAVITSEYGPAFEFERRGYGGYTRDVSCHTNLRQRRFNQEGRFHFCVPLLFAEYLGLGAITTGHSMLHTPDGLNDYRGRRPAFLRGDLVVQAGGLEDLHLLRPLCPAGVVRIIMTLEPERIEGALAASSPPNSSKSYGSVLIFRQLFEEAGLPQPPFLARYRPPRLKLPGNTVLMLYLAKRIGFGETLSLAPFLKYYDLSFLDHLTLAYMDRYNPDYTLLLDRPLRERAITLFERCGIVPYADADWEELRVLSRFLKAHFSRFADLEV